MLAQVKEKSLTYPTSANRLAGYTVIGYPPREIIPSLRSWSKWSVVAVVYIIARVGGLHVELGR
jgi:hypothetical protein